MAGRLAAATAIGLWTLAGNTASLTPDDAVHHIGQNATVCGVVASTKFDAYLSDRPTYLDFGKPYPDQVFAAVIFGADRAKFGTLETTLRGERVCVSGAITKDQGKPAIIVRDPHQLTR